MKSILIFLILTIGLFSIGGDRQPLMADFENSAAYRWLNKKVLDRRLLDDMENLDNWITFTSGAQQVVDARVDAQATEARQHLTKMVLTREKSRDGGQSLRMRMPTKLHIPGPRSGRGWGTTGVRRLFNREDWTGSNRISIWIYPDCPGFFVNWIELRLFNEGNEKLPALFGQEGETSLMLRNHEWNHVVWEISNVARDQVTSLEISYYMAGNEPEATDTATFFLDQLELQKVEPDHIEGWDVWPGRISYAHTGYQSGAVKTAIANGLNADEFHVIHQGTGETVLSKNLETVSSNLGDYQVMDFTEIRQPGTYMLESGDIRTEPFRIDPNVWRETIFKALNFFYMERCGTAIPGVHRVCHRDWRCLHEDRQIVINGGWHDAGDLTQGLGNTSEAVYAMFSLAERLHIRKEDPELYERLLEEGQWGLDWILKTSFRDGYRNGGSVSTRRTNGIIGDFDDVISKARNSPMDHFMASAAEAIGSRVLQEHDPQLASLALKMAIEDWQFGVDGIKTMDMNSSGSIFRGNFDSDNVVHEVPAAGTVASLELWKATGEIRFVEKVIEWAEMIVNSQQKVKPDWDIPLNGFFYTGPDKERILHYVHKGREHAPIQALSLLCDAFPDHPHWMKWYAAITLHARYLQTIAGYTGPYGVFPASIYRDEEYQAAPESRQESFRKQVLAGIPLGKGHYLRLFPVWMDYRGHFGTILSQAQANAWAAHLRNDLPSIRYSQHQLEWVIGRNPFSQSTMWGEGYDFPPLYSVMSGDMVGGLPVGIQTRGENDVPYWPVQNSWTYKEIWVYPVIRWIGLMRDLAGPALVEGSAEKLVEFVDISSGQKIVIQPDQASGRFRAMIPEGRYSIISGNESTNRNFLPGGIYDLVLKPGRVMDFDLKADVNEKKDIRIRVSGSGSGDHFLDIRVENLNIKGTHKALNLNTSNPFVFEWRGKILNPEMPWVAVVIPDGNLAYKKELMEYNLK
ncbi:MAG: glycoside hydrolase family 9 protein [Cyclobacteriaceae bacterium]|nr:glycoside hydrolase family 9 protein [Cyclobacteriaceae bacterium]